MKEINGDELFEWISSLKRLTHLNLTGVQGLEVVPSTIHKTPKSPGAGFHWMHQSVKGTPFDYYFEEADCIGLRVLSSREPTPGIQKAILSSKTLWIHDNESVKKTVFSNFLSLWNSNSQEHFG